MLHSLKSKHNTTWGDKWAEADVHEQKWDWVVNTVSSWGIQTQGHCSQWQNCQGYVMVANQDNADILLVWTIVKNQWN